MACLPGPGGAIEGEIGMMTLVVLGIVVVLALVVVAMYNGLVRSRVRVDEAWSGIATQLKRRHDLIPNLVETVKGYAAHEKGVLEKVTELRSRAMAAGTPGQAAQAEGLLTQALRGLYAVAENYPDLKANQNFLSLQQTLADTEGTIAGARQGYNAAVRDLNTRVESVPTNFIASTFGFTKREFFELEDPAERSVPQVRF
jgi:LemA protein